MTFLRDTRGSGYVEFLIVFLPVLFLILTLIQAALLYVGDVTVQRAAEAAARAAIVVLDDDPRYYNGAARNRLEGGSPRPVDASGHLVRWQAGRTPPARSPFGARLADIRAAASIPLLALAPPLDRAQGSRSVRDAIGAHMGGRLAARGWLYNRSALAVTFPRGPRAQAFQSSFHADEAVTVRVTYLFHCAVPLVRYLICESVPSLRGGKSRDAVQRLRQIREDFGAQSPEARSARRILARRNQRIEEWRAGVEELAHSEAPWAAALTGARGARYVVMRAEATLPNQAASYSYE